MKKILFLVLIVAVGIILIFKMQTNEKENKINDINVADAVSVDLISHASMILSWGGLNIYTDPVDETKANIFAGKPNADIILITDIHPDHLDIETIKKITKEKTIIVASKAVLDEMPEELKAKVSLMNNGETAEYLGFKVEAIPMYNLPGPNANYHTKGRGNGYVIEKDGERVYISGDTAGIPEMRNLQNIDMAFVAMNLPYTMGVEEAAGAVLDFKPKKVYPYHYRTPEGFSDVAKFKKIVNSKNPQIEVVQLDWYKKF